MGRVKAPFNKRIEIKALLEYGVTQCRVAAAVGVSKKCFQCVKKSSRTTYLFRIHLVKVLKKRQQRLMIEIYYDYVKKIELNLVKFYHLNLHCQMVYT